MQQSLHVQPNFPMGWSMAGQCLRNLGRDDDAIHAFEKSLELDQEDAGTLAALAESHCSKGDLRAAEPLYERAVRAAPVDYVYAMLNGLGNVLMDAGRHSEAADCFERSLQAFARAIVARLAHGNRRDAERAPEPAVIAEAWCECATYAAVYSTAANSSLKAFAVPTPESAPVESASQAHGSLYWEDKVDPDGCRTRHFLPNYFNRFWYECLSDPLYRVIVSSRGTALKAVGSPEADKCLSEASSSTRSHRPQMTAELAYRPVSGAELSAIKKWRSGVPLLRCSLATANSRHCSRAPFGRAANVVRRCPLIRPSGEGGGDKKPEGLWFVDPSPKTRGRARAREAYGLTVETF